MRPRSTDQRPGKHGMRKGVVVASNLLTYGSPRLPFNGETRQ